MAEGPAGEDGEHASSSALPLIWILIAVSAIRLLLMVGTNGGW